MPKAIEYFEFDWTLYKEMHQKNDCQYKVGWYVKYIGIGFPQFSNKFYKILASNKIGEDEEEYLLDGLPYLVYGFELELRNFSSDSKYACPDYCKYDSGYNCLCCDRFTNTKYFEAISRIHDIRFGCDSNLTIKEK